MAKFFPKNFYFWQVFVFAINFVIVLKNSYFGGGREGGEIWETSMENR